MSLPSETSSQRPQERSEPSMGWLDTQEQDFVVLINGLHRELNEYVDMKFNSTSDALMERFNRLCEASLSELETDCVTCFCGAKKKTKTKYVSAEQTSMYYEWPSLMDFTYSHDRSPQR